MIKPLNNHYSIENPASVYDEEAMTALELAARITAKVNEVVKTQNELQEKLPSDITKEVNIHIEKGEFDRQINKHMGNLESRVDELISKVPEGGTTMDAEVIDIRTDASGMTYANAGSAVRAQVKKAQDTIVKIGDKLGVNVPVLTTCVPGFMDGTGVANGYLTMKTPSADREVTTDYIPLLPDAYFAATITTDAGTSTGWGRAYVFDADLKPLEAYDLTGTTGKNTLTFKDRNKPGAAFVRLSYRTFGNAEATFEYIKGSDMCREFPSYWDSSDLQLLDATSWVKGYPNGTTGEIAANITDVGFTFTSALIPVTPGNYRFLYDVVNAATKLEDGNSYYAWASVSLYDENKEFISRDDYPFAKRNEDGKYKVDQVINLGEIVKYVRISARSYGNAHLFIGKVKTGYGTVSNTGNYHVKSIAHRGLSSAAPENTMAAFRAAKRAGFQYVECDVQLTSDGVPVLFHDSDLSYKTGGEFMGPVSSYPYRELQYAEVGSWFSPEFAGEVIPTLWEFLDYCRKAGLHPYIEIKSSVTDPSFLQTVYRDYADVVPMTFIGAHLSNAMALFADKARYGCLVTNLAEATAHINSYKTQARNYDIFLDVDVDSEELMPICYALLDLRESEHVNIGMEVWTANDEETITGLHGLISGVTSDVLHAGRVLAESVE